MPADEGMGIGNLAEQDARGRHELFKCQGATDEQAGETQLAQHHSVEKASEDDRQAAKTALKEAEAQQARQGKSQLRRFS